MNLISALSAGIPDAASGWAEIYDRGSSTRAWTYASFEGAGADTTGADIQLGAAGNAEVYVANVVDVRVYDIDGVLRREFTAGVSAGAVEVESGSFTGTDYDSGATGPGKPTTLQEILDSAISSFGSVDWESNLLSLKAVTSNAMVYANVKSPLYGAVGDNVTNDTAAATAAHAASDVVYYPAGQYKISYSTTAGLILPAHCRKVIGAGLDRSRIISNSEVFDLSSSVAGASFSDLSMETTSEVATAIVVLSGGARNFSFDRCKVLSGGTAVYALSGVLAKVFMDKCQLVTGTTGSAVSLISGEVSLRDCSLSNGLGDYVFVGPYIQAAKIVMNGCSIFMESDSESPSFGTVIMPGAIGLESFGTSFNTNDGALAYQWMFNTSLSPKYVIEEGTSYDNYQLQNLIYPSTASPCERASIGSRNKGYSNTSSSSSGYIFNFNRYYDIRHTITGTGASSFTIQADQKPLAPGMRAKVTLINTSSTAVTTMPDSATVKVPTYYHVSSGSPYIATASRSTFFFESAYSSSESALVWVGTSGVGPF